MLDIPKLKGEREKKKTNWHTLTTNNTWCDLTN